MNAPGALTARPSGCGSRWRAALAPGIILCAAVLAYANSFSGPFVFDDLQWIPENPRIRQMTLSALLGGTSRPIVELSLAWDYALGRLNVRGYHAVNLAVHLVAALTLYGIVRRTLNGARLRGRYGPVANRLAFAVGLLWVLHPLQTESVTYIIQRAESLMGLFYLLTLYCAIRGAEVESGRLWYGAAMIACALGMGCKPVMVTAPTMVLLYDRAFLAGSISESLRKRRSLYCGLAATWLLLPVLLRNGAQDWQSSAGFSYARARPVSYAETEPGVVVQYLRLSVWPHPLCLDYGWPIARTWSSIVPPAAFLLGLIAFTIWLGWTAPAVGFLGEWFLGILAPTSSILPVADPMFEHRMYLPLAAVVVLVVLGIHALVGRHSLSVFCALAVALGILTVRRNSDYQSAVAIWTDTVAKRPDNPRALYNLGTVLLRSGRASDSVGWYQKALRIAPHDAELHNNLGNALFQLGERTEAGIEYQAALRLKPNYAEPHNNLGIALFEEGAAAAAVEQYEEALRIKPDYSEARYNLGNTLVELGRVPEAISQYEEALRLEPDQSEARNNLGTALVRMGRLTEAIGQYEEILRSNSDFSPAHYNLGKTLFQLGRFTEAISHFEEAIRIDPQMAEAHCSLGDALLRLGRLPEAEAQLDQALQVKPDYPEARNNLGIVLVRLGKMTEARAQFEEALRLNPGYAIARSNLVNLQSSPQTGNP